MHRNASSILGLALVATLLAVVLPSRASATFHFMQIEQVAGSVCSAPDLQAVQLRMRLAGQNEVGGARLVAHDALGLNPVEIIQFPADVANGSAGDHVLVVSPNLAGVLPADFTMTNLIPASYLPAGRLTFESSGGTIYWSLAWGGSNYTGPTTGTTTNDADGDFGPPFDDPMVSMSTTALQFFGAAGDQSISNAIDYIETAAGATFTDNAGASGSLAGLCDVFSDGFESGDTTAWDSTVGGP